MGSDYRGLLKFLFCCFHRKTELCSEVVNRRLREVEVLEGRAAKFQAAAEEMRTALELAADEGEAEAFLEEARDVCDAWLEEVARIEVEVLLGGKYDAYSCQLNIFAGVGGDEACDWVCMLERMYSSFAEGRYDMMICYII